MAAMPEPAVAPAMIWTGDPVLPPLLGQQTLTPVLIGGQELGAGVGVGVGLPDELTLMLMLFWYTLPGLSHPFTTRLCAPAERFRLVLRRLECVVKAAGSRPSTYSIIATMLLAPPADTCTDVPVPPPFVGVQKLTPLLAEHWAWLNAGSSPEISKNANEKIFFKASKTPSLCQE
jgi:hypothetical protein